MEDKILLVENINPGCELTWAGCFRASKHEALLMSYVDKDIDYLLGVTERIEEKFSDLIAFWSHPDEKQNNTKVPCVIVQDRKTLTDLRKKIGYEDE